MNAKFLNVSAEAMAMVKAAVIELIASGVLEINGATVNISAGTANLAAQGPTTIKGSVIKLNC
jgi:hypothetical protein